MGFLQDFSNAFGPAFNQGFGMGYQGQFTQRQLDQELERLNLLKEQWATQKPVYEADAKLKNYQADELGQAMAMYPKLMEMINGATGGQAPSAGQPPAAPQAPPASTGAPQVPGLRPWRDPSQPVGDMINWVANYNGVDPRMFQRLIQIESEYNPRAVSPVGAIGMGQLMPGTAKSLGVTDPADPYQNLMGSARYLKNLLDQNGGDTIKALHAYNAGPENLRKGILPDETRNFIGNVTGVPLADGYGRGSVVPTAQPGGTLAPGGQGRPGVMPAVPQSSTGPVLISPRMLPILTQMSAMPGAGGKIASGILTAAKQGQDLMGFEMPADKRQNDVNAAVSQAMAIEKQKRDMEAGSPKLDDTLNVLNNLAPKISDGTATPEEARLYSLAFSSKFGEVKTLPDGSQIKQPPPPNLPLPPGWESQVAPQKPMTAQEAGRIQGGSLSAKYLTDVMLDLFDGNGEINRTKLLKSYIPGQPEQGIRQRISEAINSALYLKTGAQASPKEVAQLESIYMPALTDNSAVAMDKMVRLRAFLDSVSEGVQRQDQAKPGSPPVAMKTNLKQKYGLE